MYSYCHLLNNYSLYDLEIRKKKKATHTHIQLFRKILLVDEILCAFGLLMRVEMTNEIKTLQH